MAPARGCAAHRPGSSRRLRPARRITCRDYLAASTEGSLRVDALFPEIDGADGYAATVATAWILAVTAADQLHPRGLARPVLELASLLDPDGVPVHVWTGPAGLANLRGRRTTDAADGPQTMPQDGRAALRHLHLFNLVTHNPHPQRPEMTVHALVQRGTRDRLDDRRRAAAGVTAADGIRGDRPGSGVSDLARTRRALLAGRTSDDLDD